MYGNSPAYPTTENTELHPVSPYGVTKQSCEQLAHAYATSKGLKAIGLRYFTVYGPRQRPDMAIQRIATAVADNGRFTVYGNGDQSRDVTYVEDAVTATIAVMDTAPAGTRYNVGGGSETSLRRLIELAQELSDTEIDVDFGSPALGDVQRTAADTSLIDADTGWSARTSLEEGLVSQLAWTMSQLAWRREPAYAA